MRTCCFALIMAVHALAQGTETKRTAAEFPFQATVPNAQLGIEFMVRLISLGRESFVTEDFLIVEVAVFPEKGREIVIRPHEFTLRVNGKKDVLLAVAPSVVAASVGYSYREPNQGYGNDRFPGDPRGRRDPGPQGPPPTVGEPQQERMKPAEVITRAALPEGSRKTSASGYIYFPWRGNPAKLRNVELIITPESSPPLTVRLR